MNSREDQENLGITMVITSTKSLTGRRGHRIRDVFGRDGEKVIPRVPLTPAGRQHEYCKFEFL